MNSNEYMNDNGATPIVPLPAPNDGNSDGTAEQIGRAHV